jgi:cold shock CspA family protein
MIGQVIVWDQQNKFGFIRTTAGKTFFMRDSSFRNSQHLPCVVVGTKVEFNKLPRDKSFDNALNAGLFRDDPRIVNHRNPRIVDKTKKPMASNVRFLPPTEEQR